MLEHDPAAAGRKVVTLYACTDGSGGVCAAVRKVDEKGVVNLSAGRVRAIAIKAAGQTFSLDSTDAAAILQRIRTISF